ILRNLLRNDALVQQVMTQNWGESQAEALADVMTGVESPGAGQFLYQYLLAQKEALPDQVGHTVRFVPASQISQVIQEVRKRSDENVEQESKVFRAVQQGLIQRGASQAVLRNWGAELAEHLFEEYAPSEAKVDTLPDEEVKNLAMAASLAGEYQLEHLVPQLKTSLNQPAESIDLPLAAVEALLQIDPQQHASLIQSVLEDQTTDLRLKRNLITNLGETDAAVLVLKETNNLPPELQTEMALALSATPNSREVLFEKVKAGNIFARALVDPKVKERMLLNISDEQLQIWEEITGNIPAVNEERDDLIQTRLTSFQEADSVAVSGVMVFNRNCKACHRVSNEGGMIGPQLTGIGSWGAEALATKILDPNRNISEAFRTYTIKTNDGKVMTGLFRREEGESLVFANMSGEEFSVSKSSVAEQKASQYTLMPDHFGESLSQPEFNALLTYLLELQS
ncbi:MAG: c-type cytochrome, partial [Bacteroidota bacterium]